MFVWSKRLVANLLGLFVLMLGVFLSSSSGQHQWPEDTHDTLDGPQLYRLDYLGLCLDDRSSPHAREKCLGLACALRPRTLPTLMLFVLFLQRRISRFIDR